MQNKVNLINNVLSDIISFYENNVDKSHGLDFIDNAVIDQFNIEYNNNCTALVYNNNEYDSLYDILNVDDNILIAYYDIIIDSINNSNWIKQDNNKQLVPTNFYL
jgi:hypothetical protein